MSGNFEWQTEDDIDWEEQVDVPEPSVRSRRLSWRAIGTILTLVVLAALVVFWQFQRRVEAATMAVEADILSSHNLLSRVAVNKDIDLLAPLLSGRDLSWTKIQEQLVEEDLYQNRASLGMVLPDTNTYTALSREDERFVDLVISPELTTAELLYLQEYTVAGSQQSVTLEHTAVYRQGKTRWLLAPMESDFWGQWETYAFGRIEIIAPARDRDLARRLARDLGRLLRQICVDLDDLTCPIGLSLRIRFEKDPKSLLETADLVRLYTDPLDLSLPTPTLVGLPVDDESYEVLYRGYAARVAAAMITHLIGYECCDHASFYHPVMDYQLYKLGLRAWPVTFDMYTQVVNHNLTVESIFPFWLESSFTPLTEESAWQVYAFVDFLMKQSPSLTPTDVLRELIETPNFARFFADLRGQEFGIQGEVLNEMLRDWWFFAYTQVAASTSPRPIPFPEQELHLVCADTPIEMSHYRYSPGIDEWREELQVAGLMFLNPLPTDDAVVLQLFDYESENWKTQIWQNGEHLSLPVNETALSISYGQTDPTGQHLLVYTVETSDAPTVATLVEWQSCDDESCNLDVLPANPIWSPDGQQTLLIQEDGIRSPLYNIDDRIAFFGLYSSSSVSLMRGDAGGHLVSLLPEPGLGRAPFWLTDDLYGYIRPASTRPDETQQELVIASIKDDVPQPVLRTTDLLAAIPESERPNYLTMAYAMVNPMDPNLLVVVADSQQGGYLFVVDRQTKAIEMRIQFGDGISLSHTFGFSPDGRYFVTSGGASRDVEVPEYLLPTFGAIYLHDIAQNETRSFVTSMTGVMDFLPAYRFDWSADGNWLAIISNQGVITLVAPDYDYQQTIQHEHGQCTSVAWVNATE